MIVVLEKEESTIFDYFEFEFDLSLSHTHKKKRDHFLLPPFHGEEPLAEPGGLRVAFLVEWVHAVLEYGHELLHRLRRQRGRR